jgi:hypothetical protein
METRARVLPELRSFTVAVAVAAAIAGASAVAVHGGKCWGVEHGNCSHKDEPNYRKGFRHFGHSFFTP